MSVVERPCWHCDVCGFEWLKTASAPIQCASGKCRSRKWNQSFIEQAIERGRKVGAIAVRINDTEYPIRETIYERDEYSQ